MLTIPETPDKPVCSACSTRLVWLWSPRTQSWVAFVPVEGDREALRVHRCQGGQDAPTWRQLEARLSPSAEVAERTRRGVAMATAAIRKSERTDNGGE